MAAQMFGPPAPVKKKAPARSGPIQPAFPLEDYTKAGGPWAGLLEGNIPLQPEPVELAPPPKEAPMAMPPTRLSESPFDRANIQMVGPTDEGELPLQIDPNYVQRPTIGNRPGESAKASLDSELRSFKRAQENTSYTPEEYNEMLGTVRGTPEIQDMLAAQKDREEMLAEMMGARAPSGVDLTPLMALTDQWSGSKFTNSYKPPSTSQDLKLLLDYEAKAQDDKQKLAETILKAPQLLKSGTAMDQFTQMLKEGQDYGVTNKPVTTGRGSQRAASIDEKFLITKAEKLHSSFQEDKDQMSRLLANLERGDLQSLNMSLGYVARQLGGQKGVLTDRDIEMVMPKTFGKTLAEAEAYFNNPNAKLTPEITKGLKELAKIAMRNSEKKHREMMATFKNSVRNSSMAPLVGVLDPYETSIGSPMVPAQQAAPQKPKGESIKDMLRKRIDDRLKKEGSK